MFRCHFPFLEKGAFFSKFDSSFLSSNRSRDSLHFGCPFAGRACSK